MRSCLVMQAVNDLGLLPLGVSSVATGLGDDPFTCYEVLAPSPDALSEEVARTVTGAETSRSIISQRHAMGVSGLEDCRRTVIVCWSGRDQSARLREQSHRLEWAGVARTLTSPPLWACVMSRCLFSPSTQLDGDNCCGRQGLWVRELMDTCLKVSGHLWLVFRGQFVEQR